MKKIITYLPASFLFIVFVHSQVLFNEYIPFNKVISSDKIEPEDKNSMYSRLNEEQKQEYIRNKLTVEITNLEGDLDDSDYKINFKWTAFRGINTPISKQEFLDITGYKHESIQEKNKQTGESLAQVGMLTAFLGFMLAIIPSIDTDMKSKNFSDAKHTRLIPGLIISTCGAGLIVCGALKSSNSKIPFNVAKNIADEYNRNLLSNIEKRYNIRQD